MKKNITIIFALALVMAVVVTLSACAGIPACNHRDADDNSLCDKCGERFEDGKDLQGGPTCEHRDADDNSLCDKCGESFEDGEDVAPHTHEYSVQNTDNKYLATAADCENKATYYYSCSCGDKGSESFSYGDAKGHTYDNYVCTECNDVIIPSEGLKFTLNKDGEGYTVTGIGECRDTDIIIPYTYINKPVTSIGESAFEGCATIINVTILNNITNIEDWAFSNCQNLTKVTVGNGVLGIGKRAFYNCRNLSNVTMGNSVTNIGDYAFYDCRSIKSLTIKSITSIGERAFQNCYSLESVTIGKNITSIGEWGFGYCIHLAAVNYCGSAEQWNAVSKGSYWSYESGKYTMVYDYIG